jgi:oligoendopeptidase F
MQHELGKWNLDELAKNPTRMIIDKKLTKIESDAKRFERKKITKSKNFIQKIFEINT